MAHGPAFRGCFPAGVQMQGFHPTVCGLPGASEWPKGHCSGLCLNREAGGSGTLVARKASVPSAAAEHKDGHRNASHAQPHAEDQERRPSLFDAAGEDAEVLSPESGKEGDGSGAGRPARGLLSVSVGAS